MPERTYVILAAGRGSRMGRVGGDLHKSLVPLGDKALLSHVIDLAPEDAKIVVVVGHKSDQVRNYLQLAHPHDKIYVVNDDRDWSFPGGPGRSIFTARNRIKGDMIVTCVDTLYNHIDWDTYHQSWVGSAGIPEGTDPMRWCRVLITDNGVKFIEKGQESDVDVNAFMGLAYIARKDVNDFFTGLDQYVKNIKQDEELQLTPGFRNIKHLERKCVNGWIDVGDEDAYITARERFGHFDMDKPDTATYVIPENERVVKYWNDDSIVNQRRFRAIRLGSRGVTPKVIDATHNMMSYQYIPGETGYQRAIEDNIPGDTTRFIMDWAHDKLWYPISIEHNYALDVAIDFYYGKTVTRIDMMNDLHRELATECINMIDFRWLCNNIQPGLFHGDFHLGNIIFPDEGLIKLIDWRENFAGCVTWGDIRYDHAKMIAGSLVHWERAKINDFSEWEYADDNIEAVTPNDDVRVIAGLCLINSSPLHAEPLNTIALYRGIDYIKETLK